ncbi:histamine H2 receptor [Exaiptasia diaphana]|uniref:G-protein coupled receptors family 1 profile domain-containing protein n=1 Tax=Exaiptasia diaphana TaxID=2652724 RepID=A0A913YNS7_EXADI|nr:histamine H2 receptor [Exaiptasia diaphana]
MSTLTRTSYSGCLISDKSLEYYVSIGYLPDSVRHTWIILSIVNSIASPLTIVINLLIIWTVVKDTNLRNVNYNILLAALAVTDLIVGLVVEPLFSFHLICFVLGCSTSCTATPTIIAQISCAGSTLIIFMVSSVERYLAIEHTQFYLEKVTTKKIILATVLACLIIPTATLSARILLNDHGHLQKAPIAVAAGLNVLIILYCSMKVQVTAYRQRRAIAAHAATVQLQQEEQEKQERRLEEHKRAFTMGVLVLASILLYCPYIINAILLANNGGDRSNFISTPGFAATFIHLQSLLNPIIVSLRLSYIREGVKNKLCCRE